MIMEDYFFDHIKHTGPKTAYRDPEYLPFCRLLFSDAQGDSVGQVDYDWSTPGGAVMPNEVKTYRIAASLLVHHRSLVSGGHAIRYAGELPYTLVKESGGVKHTFRVSGTLEFSVKDAH